MLHFVCEKIEIFFSSDSEFFLNKIEKNLESERVKRKERKSTYVISKQS